jgi:hypothetical protein
MHTATHATAMFAGVPIALTRNFPKIISSLGSTFFLAAKKSNRLCLVAAGRTRLMERFLTPDANHPNYLELNNFNDLCARTFFHPQKHIPI